MAKVTMPQLGESVAEGTIGKWLKQPGDTVEKYEPLLEVITDKVNAEVPSPFAGVLKEILVEEGATVPNNAEIAIIETADESNGTSAAKSEAPPAAAAPDDKGAPADGRRRPRGRAGSDRAARPTPDRRPPQPTPPRPLPRPTPAAPLQRRTATVASAAPAPPTAQPRHHRPRSPPTHPATPTPG